VLSQTAPDAQVIGVIDSDYMVRPDWLKAWCRISTTAKISYVQAPQDHRDWTGDRFKEMLNWEYAGFFDIGMCLRNEYDAIIQHGTMTLVRRDLMEELGGWATWCITEDTELGLRLMEKGLRRHVQPRALRPRPDARSFRRLQEAALPLGLRRHADHEGACRQDAGQLDQAHLLAEVSLSSPAGCRGSPTR
jgi:Glycosyltransferases, probably involved in cell wall biogenesis